MATIPIEVIVQDGPSPEPTPTPSDPGETNIVVPDTGVGTVENGSNGGGIGSATNIILPAIILVLAIGAIVAIMVHRYQKRKKANDGTEECNVKVNKRVVSRKEKLATVARGTIAIFAATVLVGNLVIPATSAATSVEPGTAELDTVDKITITATREIDSDIVVATVKNTSYATANLDFGYKVTASMIEGATTANLYLDGDETSKYYISPVTDRTLADNTWGYTLTEPTEESSYQSIPLSTKPTNIIKEIAKTAEDKPVDIYYTVQIDKDMPNGTYTGELEYTISPTIEYMQDFSTLTPAEKTATLAYMPEGKQYILKDIRDEKPYYISRLADGNVWMTQNLDFNIVNGGANLNSANTDVPQDWADAGSLTNTHTNTTWNRTDVTPESYDLGDLYWNGALIYNQETCEANGGAWQPWGVCEDADSTSSTGNSHYHLGNYYNWTAAVAMSDSSAYTTDGQDVNQSICPAGWRLPTYSGDKSYEKLASMQSLIAGTDGDIQNDPTYFVYGGYQETVFQGGGNYGGYWSSVAKGRIFSYLFSFNASGRLNAQDHNSRGYGYSLRCVAR